MKLFKMNRSKLQTGYYGFNNVKFAICTPPKDRLVDSITQFHGCREEVVKKIRAELSRKKPRIDQKKTRLLMYGRHTIDPRKGREAYNEEHCKAEGADFYRKALVGLALVNYLEKEHNWAPTKLYKIDPEYNLQDSIYMFVGSPKWQKSPHYLSLYMLMLRLGKSGITMVTDEKRRTAAYMAGKLATYSTSGKYDSSHIKNVIGKIDLLLSNQNVLIGRKPMKEMFSVARLGHGNNGFNEGITSLCTGNSYDLMLSYKFQDLCRKAGIHHRINRTPDPKVLGEL